MANGWRVSEERIIGGCRPRRCPPWQWSSLRPPHVAVSRSEDAEEPAHLNKRATPGSLDLGDRPRGLSGITDEAPPRSARLRVHPFEAPQDHRLELSGDSSPLDGDRAPGELVPLVLKLVDGTPEVGGDPAPSRLCPTSEPGQSDPCEIGQEERRDVREPHA